MPDHSNDLVRLHEQRMSSSEQEIRALRKDFAVSTGEIKESLHRIETKTLGELVGGVAQEAAKATQTAEKAHVRIDSLDTKFGFILKLLFGGGGLVFLSWMLYELFKGYVG